MRGFEIHPLAIDLFCGLGGWSDGLIAEGWQVIGFDIERHVYGEQRYPGQLVLQDALTLHGSQFRNASLIVASPPCTEYSYMAMPWSRAKQIAGAFRGECGFPNGYDGSRTIAQLNALFDACFRIQREACEAAGRYIPMVVENVKGAQPWVEATHGRAKANFGSFYLWGDVDSIGGRIVKRGEVRWGAPSVKANSRSKFKGGDRNKNRANGYVWTSSFADTLAIQDGSEGHKNSGGSWFNIAHNTESGVGQNPDGRKVPGFNFHEHENGRPGRSFQSAAVEGVKNGNDWFGSGENYSEQRKHGSNSSARRAASAQIAKIPEALASHIARIFKPGSE